MTSSPETMLAWKVPGFGDPSPHASHDRAADALPWVPDDLGLPRAPATRLPADAAYARGFDDGVRDGYARASDEVRPAAAMLACVVSHLADAADEFARDRERDLEGLALAIARRIIQREVTVDPGIVRDLITRGLELLPLDAEVTVRVNPDDLAALGDAIERISTPGRAVTLHWLADAAIERGSFVAESPQRMVDGRSDVALRALYERFGDG